MNEKLLALYKQSYVPGTAIDPTNDMPYDTTYFSADKFAELIIKACTKQCNQEWCDTNNNVVLNAETDPRMVGIKIGIKQGAMKCSSRINEHFGVES